MGRCYRGSSLNKTLCKTEVMATAILPELALDPRRKRWTVEEAYRIQEMLPDLLPGRWELIEGELIDKMGQKPPHAWVITRLNVFLTQQFADRVRIQLPLSLPDPDRRSEPEPDIVVLHSDARQFFDRHPGPGDVALLIEVADTTREVDLNIKSALYARYGVGEYWVIDIPQRCVVVHRGPSVDIYTSVEEIPCNKEVAAVFARFDAPLTLDTLLG